MMLALLILAATPPPPTSSYIELRSGGTLKGRVFSLNCTGSASCVADAGFGTVNVTAATFDGGGLAPSNATYITQTCNSLLSAEQCMSALGTGLVLSTTTTGVQSIYAGSSCGAGTYASATNASGALTCGTPAGVPGGSSPQVQYNNSGAFGGMARVKSDGVRLQLVGENPSPATPSADLLPFVLNFDAGFPQLPMMRGSYFGLPTPVGFFNDFSAIGTDARWEVTCIRPNGYASTGTSNTNLAGGAAIAVSGNSTAPGWATTSLYTRSRVLLQTATSTAANLNAGVHLQTALQGAWRGDGADKGGFLYWTRVAINTGAAGTNQQRAFFGLVNRTTAIAANANPSTFADTVYIGADSNEQNLSICSNDNSGSATCNTLGASFPATTTGAFYDVWFVAAPGTSQIEWYISRLDSAATASGTLSSDLPRNSVQLNWQALINTGSAGGVAVALGWLGSCLAYNY